MTGMESPSGAGPQRGPNGPRRRTYSIWTLLAPAAVVVLWIAFFMALGDSCVFKDCGKDTGEAKAADANVDPENDLPQNARAKVKNGDTLGKIADKYKLSEDELKACNPDVDPQALQPGAYLFVAGSRCEGADLAKAGANPDPLAGDTAAGATGGAAKDPSTVDPTANGTAAADPSTKVAPDPDAATAESGDEG